MKAVIWRLLPAQCVVCGKTFLQALCPHKKKECRLWAGAGGAVVAASGCAAFVQNARCCTFVKIIKK